MINFDKLNKKKTYCGLQYGDSLIAKEIRKFSKCYAPNSKEIPTHVAMFVYRFDSWWVYESHSKGCKALGVPEGVRRYRIEIWKHIEKNWQSEFKAFQIDVDLKVLENLIGQPYGTGDIKSLMKAALFKTNGKQKDRFGEICSEYFAEAYPKICEFYGLPAHCITPAHVQNYIDIMKIKEAGV